MSEDFGLEAFKVESAELLDELEHELLNLESSPGDPEILNSIFRVAHTLKGSSGVVGLDGVVRFTHTFENLLDQVRKGLLNADDVMVELLLDTRDYLAQLVYNELGGIGLDSDMELVEKSIVGRMHALMGVDESGAAEEPSGVPEDEGLPEITERSVQCEDWHLSLRFGPEVFRSGMDPISFLLYLDEVGQVLKITPVMDSMPSIRQVEPDVCYMGFELQFRSNASRAEIMDVFEFVAEDCDIRLVAPRAPIDDFIRLLADLPEPHEFIGDILVESGALTPMELLKVLKEGFIAPQAEDAGFGEYLAGDTGVPAEARPGRVAPQGERTWNTIPVEVRKLDMLINLVGEMVISGANVVNNANRYKDRDLTSSVGAMARLIEEIRDQAMSVRMIPIQSTLIRFQRVVRDICKASAKDIQLIVEGGETELDRNIVERIKEPLVHIIRNAADHGIESPQDRESSGKPRQGTVKISAYQDMGDVVIEISDDGRGLDRDMILSRAIDLGLVAKGANLSESDIYDFITMPGFSTAAQVTDISGRGVGMETARKAVEDLRGSISMGSVQGKGSVFSMRLPLTLAIIDGLLVKLSGEFFVLPLDLVGECLDFAPSDARRDTNYINLRGGMLPYVSLREAFELEEEGVPGMQSIVVVSHLGRNVGIMVDSFHGVVQAVVKPMGKVYEDIEFLLGATILGDGRVAMILDVAEIVRSEHERLDALHGGGTVH